VDAAGVREQRRRMLPAWLVVYYVVALALFVDVGGGRVTRKLAGTLAWASRGLASRCLLERCCRTRGAVLGLCCCACCWRGWLGRSRR
jgi:hypothetical protein